MCVIANFPSANFKSSVQCPMSKVVLMVVTLDLRLWTLDSFSVPPGCDYFAGHCALHRLRIAGPTHPTIKLGQTCSRYG